jgi:hypothetical protein
MRARHVAPLLPIENEVVEDEDVGFTGDSSRISGAGFSTNLPILGVLNFIWGITVMVPFGFFRALRKVAREGGGVRFVSSATPGLESRLLAKSMWERGGREVKENSTTNAARHHSRPLHKARGQQRRLGRRGRVAAAGCQLQHCGPGAGEANY